jgi:hypothetical protein
MDLEKADLVQMLILLIENNREYNIQSHLAFVDIRKAFGTVVRIKLMDVRMMVSPIS